MNNEIAISEEIKNELTRESSDVVNKSREIVIKTEADNERATAFLSTLKTMRVKIEDKIMPAVKQAKVAYDEIRKLKDDMIRPLSDAEADLRAKIGAFVAAENARRAALQEKADKKFEKAVQKAEATGKPLTVAPQIIKKVTSTNSASFSVVWYAEVTDIKLLCKAIADGKVDIKAIEPNMPYLNAIARSYKSEKEILPGIVAKKKVVTRV